jgi:hypothetical protein
VDENEIIKSSAEKLADKTHTVERIEKTMTENMGVAQVFLCFFLVTTGLNFVLAFLYRITVQRNTFKLKEALGDKKGYRESVRAIKQSVEKNQEKRSYYE